MGLHVILRDAFAVGVHDPEVVLRVGVSLLRRQPKLPHRFGVVLRDPFAVAVLDPKVVLRAGVSLFSR